MNNNTHSNYTLEDIKSLMELYKQDIKWARYDRQFKIRRIFNL